MQKAAAADAYTNFSNDALGFIFSFPFIACNKQRTPILLVLKLTNKTKSVPLPCMFQEF